MDKNEEIKKLVDSFAERMHAKILQRQARWGNATWKNSDPLDLLAHLNKEVAELVEEMAKARRSKGFYNYDLLLMEAVDVANLAMMIADRYATLIKDEVNADRPDSNGTDPVDK